MIKKCKSISIKKVNKLPNLFIVGAGKSGTTSLYEYLKEHPDVYMSPIKEPHFLADKRKLMEHFDINIKDIITNEKDYLKLFQGAKNEKILGEASTSYLYYTDPKIIKEKFPNSKIIIMLRNPIERAWSHYLMGIRGGFINPYKISFREAINKFPIIIRLGFYSKNVYRYLKVFGSDLHIILFDDFRENTLEVIEKVYQFLDINNYIPKLEIYNKGVLPRNKFSFYLIKIYRKVKFYKFVPKNLKTKVKPFLFIDKKKEISDKDKKFLLKLYKEDILELSKILGRDLSHWLEL